jgi:Tfp pilus assembly protein PilF
MSHRKHAKPARTTDDRYDDGPARPSQYTWIVYAVGMLLVGGLAGYVLSIAGTGGSAPAATTAASTAAPAAGAAAPAAGMVDDVALKAYRDILARDPKNVQAAVSAGNMLYDAKRYEEAIPFYQQAMAANGRDVNVSTDLGTALWYTGRADAALAQYAVSLTIEPAHAQTLYNMGIVRSDGKKDFAGAAQAWETLLQTNPSYPNAANVRTMIAEAKGKAGKGN